MKFLLGRKYIAYRAYTLPKFTESHLELITANVARYIYLKYTSTTTDLIPRYLAIDDVLVAVNSDRIVQNDLEIVYLTIDHSMTQVVAFFRKNNKIVVLIDLPLPLFLVQMLEALDFDTPLILQAIPITSETVHSVTNSLGPFLRLDSTQFGEMSITFAPREKLTDDSLREIVVTVPLRDSKRLIRDSKSAPLEAILEWITKTTTLKLQNMHAKSIDCDLFSISTRGRLTLKPNDTLTDSTLGVIFADVSGAL